MMPKAILQLETGERVALGDVIIRHTGFNEITIHATRYDGVFNSSNAVMKSAKPEIVDVIFNDPATIVIWSDGTKTVVKCQVGDTYNKELGLAMCIAKKFLGNKGNYNEVFKQYIEEV